VEDAWADANGLKETLVQRDELLSEKIRKMTEVRPTSLAHQLTLLSLTTQTAIRGWLYQSEWPFGSLRTVRV
jgi:hypothetical protein